MNLKGNKVSLRAVEPTDVDLIYMLENADDPCGLSLCSGPVSRHSVWEYVNGYDGDIFRAKELRMMIVDNSDGNTVGCIDIADFDPVNGHGFVGVFLSEQHRGKGLGSEALALMMEYAFVALGMHQLAAMVSVENVRSRRLFESAGFKSCGCLRSWVRRNKSYADVLVYQKLAR